jgi:hypothetical protein
MPPKFQVSYNGVDTGEPFESLSEALCGAMPRDSEANIHKLRDDGESIWMAYASGPVYRRRWELTSNGIVEARK